MLAALLLLRGGAAAFAQTGYSGSVSFVRSQDSSARTEAIYLFNSLDLAKGAFRASVTIPVITQRTTWIGDPTAVTPNIGWQTGVGDPIVRAEVQVAGRRDGRLMASLGGAVKIPIADVDRGFGSGKADLAVSVTLMGIRGRSSFLADVSYWVTGDSEGEPLRNVPAVYLGYALVLDRSSRWSAIVSVGSSPSIIPGLAAPTQVQVTVLRGLRPGAGLGLTLSIGLTDSAADFSLGASWRALF